jgi:hypothetical protein
VEDALQLLTGHIALAGLALVVVGCWFGWPRPQRAQPGQGVVFTFAQAQTVFGLIIAFIGLVLMVIGLASHPLY